MPDPAQRSFEDSVDPVDTCAGATQAIQQAASVGAGSRIEKRGALLARGWRASPEAWFVALVWVWMFFGLVSFEKQYATNVPFSDDMSCALAMDEPLRLDALWAQQNEHRIPLPRLAFVAISAIAGRDLRAGTVVHAGGLALLALGMILAARRLRGSASFTDAFFPLIWMHVGNAFNLLMEFQLAIFLPVLFASVALLAIASIRAAPGRVTSWVVGACTLCLPLCGASGLGQTPALVAWMVFAGFALWRSPDPRARSASRWLFAASVAAVALGLFYLVGLEFPYAHDDRIGRVLLKALQFLCLSAGPSAAELWPEVAWVVLAVGCASLLLLVLVVRRSPEERLRAAGIAASMLGVVSMALSVGWGRMAGADEEPIVHYTMRYVTLPNVFVCGAYFAWLLYGRTRWREFVSFVLCAGALIALPINTRQGLSYAAEHRQNALALMADVLAHRDLEELAARNWQTIYPATEAEFLRHLRMLWPARLPPFQRRSPDEQPKLGTAAIDPELFARLSPDEQLKLETPVTDPELFARLSVLETPPQAARSDRPIVVRPIGGVLFLCVWPAGELWYRADRRRAVHGSFGLLPAAYERGSSDGVRFTIEARARTGGSTLLFERRLDPRNQPADRGRQPFSLALDPSFEGSLVFATSNDPGKNDESDWSYWSGIVFDE